MLTIELINETNDFSRLLYNRKMTQYFFPHYFNNVFQITLYYCIRTCKTEQTAFVWDQSTNISRSYQKPPFAMILDRKIYEYDLSRKMCVQYQHRKS